jgi:hypothetical protein
MAQYEANDGENGLLEELQRQTKKSVKRLNQL